MQHIYDKVQRHITASNDNYKAHADKCHRFLEFYEGDMVMVHIHLERLPVITFNDAGLTLYRGHDNEEFEKQVIALPAAPPEDKIIDVLDNQLVSTHQGRFQKFLVCWQNCPISYATWITATNYQCLNLDLYEYYQAINSPKSSFSKAGRVNVVRTNTKPKKTIGPTN
eukprot:TRINITY_DN13182_c0_g2_i3.p1 TRINITY_DN13182_c0_g2~~TRINITY_DN13182_c0_g2_i3.p1  ORF type:complete len:168 (+),score=11.42 TRINITY_DN13182_c0_g2_i3:2628-3131(+)